MADFGTQRAAKEYLVSKIVAEAERDRKALSDIERKMLYFSETDWAPPGMPEANAEFERTCDTDEYEQKIAALARKIEARNKKENGAEQRFWNAAVEKLSEGDHYLLVMLSSSFSSAGKSARPPGDLLKLWLTGFVIACGLAALFVLYHRFFDPR
jgi:hypothetical protein